MLLNKFKNIKILKSLKSRIFFSFSAMSFLLILFFSLYFINFTLDHVIELDKVKIEKTADEFSLKIFDFANQNLTLAKSVAISLENYETIKETERRKTFNNLLKNTLENSNDIVAIWVRFKPYSIDHLDSIYENKEDGISGQYIKTYYKDRKHVIEKNESIADVVFFNNFISENTRKQNAYILPHLVNEYKDSYTNKTNIVRFIVPIYNQNKFVGIVGVDVDIKNITDIISAEQQFYKIYLLSDDNRFIIHPNPKVQDKELTEAYPYLSEEYQFLKNLREGKKMYKLGNFLNETESNYYVFSSLTIPQANTVWNVAVGITERELYSQKRERTYIILILATLLFAGNLIFFWLLSNAVANSLNSISKFLSKVSQGEFEYKNTTISKWTSNELKSISLLTEKLKNGLQRTENFANDISNNKLDSYFTPLSENDNLGISLIKLKQSLLENKKEEQIRKRKQEDVNWTNSGITKFADILRLNLNSIDKLAYETIRNLTDYVGAVQGGFFIYNKVKGLKYLELTAFYSYNRKIYKRKIIKLGDGLVGTCALEQKIIHMEIPDNYLEITSGLGGASPRYVVLSPLIYDGQIMGVIEIASLNKFSDLHIDFIKKTSESIGSSLETVKINEQTVELLTSSEKQATNMAKKEKELKDKIAEFEIEHKKAKKAEKQMKGFIDSLNKTGHTAEFDSKTKLISINNQLLSILRTTYQDATTKNYYEILNIDIEDLETHQNYWRELEKNNVVKFIQKIKINKKEIWLDIILSPILDDNDIFSKVLLIAFDNTKMQKQKQEIENLVAQTQEKVEQLKIQEKDMDFTYQELEKMYEQVDEKNNEMKKIEKEKSEIEKRVEFFQKELEKRIKRFHKIETNLKERNKELVDEIKKMKS